MFYGDDETMDERERSVRWPGLVHEMARLLLHVPSEQREELSKSGLACAEQYADKKTLIAQYEQELGAQIEAIKKLGLHAKTGFEEHNIEVMFERLHPGLTEIGLSPPERIPFLVVIPDAMVDFATQCKAAGISFGAGNLEKYVAQQPIIDDIYLLIDVEIGLATRQCTGHTAAQKIVSKKRVPLMGCEFAALARVDVAALQRLSMNMIGTRAENDRHLLWDRKSKNISFDRMNQQHDNTGTPSAARRWVQEYTL